MIKIIADFPRKQNAERARSEKFFPRMYGKLFLLTACVASTCPQRPGVAAFRTLTPGTFTSDTSELEI
jgi:hypothetical protein